MPVNIDRAFDPEEDQKQPNLPEEPTWREPDEEKETPCWQPQPVEGKHLWSGLLAVMKLINKELK